jgi:Delta7-sterol 5-desaturase
VFENSLKIILNLNYLIVYFLTVFYFVFLYFGMGFLFNQSCKFLKNKNLLNEIRPNPINKEKQKKEIYHSIISILVFGFSGIALVFLLKNELCVFIKPTFLNTVFGLFILMVWNEIHFYFMHRLLHIPFLYRKIHKIHHQSKIPSVFSVYSFHWIEALLLSSVPLFVVPLYDFSILSVVLFPLSSILFNFAGHCNYRFGNGTGKRFTLFGTNHAKHHFFNKGEYGFITPILDILFHKNK